MNKPIWLSKTVIIAILQGILGILVALGTSIPNVGWLLIAKSALDIIIRCLTTQAVKL